MILLLHVVMDVILVGLRIEQRSVHDDNLVLLVDMAYNILLQITRTCMFSLQ